MLEHTENPGMAGDDVGASGARDREEGFPAVARTRAAIGVRRGARNGDRHDAWLAAAFAGAGLVALLAAGCGGSSRSEQRLEEAEARLEAQAVLVSASDVVIVGRERLESGITFTGELVPVDEVTIGARFDGDLEDVYARAGNPVRRGQALARFQPRDVRNVLEAAAAELEAARAALISAENSERRARRLLEAGAAAPSDLEAAEAGRTAAGARVRAAEAQLGVARENADRLGVPAPFTGWVSQVFVHPGDHVAVGDPLVTVVRRDTLELSATIPSEALGRVRTGSPIVIRVEALPGETFHGALDRINPTTEPGTRQIRIYTRVPNEDGRLIGGLFATGRIVDEVRNDAVTAPVRVLRREGEEQVVYRVRGGTAERVPVRTGALDEERGVAELVGGVQAGDSLLSGVVPGLRVGARVRVILNGGNGTAPAGGGTDGNVEAAGGR